MTILNPPSPLAGSQLTVLRERLHFDDPRIGGVYGSSANQGQKLQDWFAMCAAATGAETVAFLGGDVQFNPVTHPLTWPTSRHFRLEGAGAGDYVNNGPAALIAQNDPGAGKWAITIPTGALTPRGRDFLLLGLSPAPVVGTKPWQGGGLLVQNGAKFWDVRVRGFGDGWGLINDHMEFWSCDARGNGINVNFLDNPLGGLGDVRFERCYLIDATQASMAIASTNCIANALYTQGHWGAGPFGMYRYQALVPATGVSGQSVLTGVNVAYTPVDGMTVNGPQTSPGVDSTVPVAAATKIATGGVAGSAGNWTLTLDRPLTGTVTQVELGRRNQATAGLTISRNSVEYAGNAFVYDEVGGASWELDIKGNAEFGTGGSAKWAGKPTPMANIYADSVDIDWDGNGPSPQSDIAGQPYVSAKTARIVIEKPLAFFDAAYANIAIPEGHDSFVWRTGGGGGDYYDCQLGRRMPGSGGGPCGGIRVASEAILRGELLEDNSTNRVRRYRGDQFSRLIGVATKDVALNGACMYTTQGKRNGTVVRNAGAAITQGRLVKPDRTNQGCVVVATDDRDGPIVGRIHDTAIPAAGSTFTADTSTVTTPQRLRNPAGAGYTAPLGAGSSITGAGIPAGTTVERVDTANGLIYISQPVTATATGVTITVTVAAGPVDVYIS